MTGVVIFVRRCEQDGEPQQSLT
ncbi:uncharacterized protein METZ01_LOCUS361822 [marine metagenome]|uniref:Uncharacterized protein n=1 Tax=marine metagenome TaxID=408172 RepID=A0A382SIF6_9ZZZZ